MKRAAPLRTIRAPKGTRTTNGEDDPRQLGLFERSQPKRPPKAPPATDGAQAASPGTDAPRPEAIDRKSRLLNVLAYWVSSQKRAQPEGTGVWQSMNVQRPPNRDELVRQRALRLNMARQRTLILIVAFAAIAMLGAVKLAALGLDGRGSRPAALATTLIPARGEITDRRGVPLARMFRSYSIWFNAGAMTDGGPPLVQSPEKVARKLGAIMPGLDAEATRERLARGRSAILARKILPEQANEVLGLGEIALETPRTPSRHYPQGRLASHVLGRVIEGGDGVEVGAFGMEQALEQKLSDPRTRAYPQALSIDLRVQGALEDEMLRGMLAASAKGAAGIVLDVDTGEIMAQASLPDFDPNRIAPEDVNNTTNRVTYLTGELGSTFKPLTVAAALDAGVVRDLSASWNAKPVEIANRSFRDFEEKGDRLNIPQALAYSSNTVTMRVASEVGGEQLRRVMMDLGMHEAPAIELAARGKPFWPQGEWSTLTTMTVGYGHGISVTPLHLANAYAAMVNGGIYRDATLLRVEPGTRLPGRRVFKASTSHRMRQLLRMVTIYGTGRSADAKGYRVGGKTGSAEKLVNGRYARSKLISTFAAAFPMDDPRYVVVVALDEPRITSAVRGRTAAHNAAPIVGRVIPRIGPMLGVRPDDSRDVDISDLAYLMEKP